MKTFFYNIFALFFNISTLLFPVREDRVAFLSMHNENFRDSLGCVYEELRKEGGYRFVLIERRELSLKSPIRAIAFFLNKSRLLATSKYVFLNDNFMPMGKLRFKKGTVITQLWHGEGAFKKFGLDIPQSPEVRKRELEANSKLTYVICSSQGVRDIYASAFGVDKEKVLPLGSPRLDYILKEENALRARKKTEELYPFTKGKKIVLYAPTFRDDRERDRALLDTFSSERLIRELGEEYVLFIRLHPQIHSACVDTAFATDVTDYEDVRELILASDILITDYSSICLDFCALDKKIVFYCPDLEWYKERRDFYFDYEKGVPGRVCKSFGELSESIKAPVNTEKIKAFKEKNLDYCDTNSSERVIRALMCLKGD